MSTRLPEVNPRKRDELFRELDDCDDEIAGLRRGDGEEKKQQLLGCLDRGLELRRKLYAESSPEIASACSDLCEACNFQAIRMLEAHNLKGARDLLKRAEEVSARSPAGRAITYNNLACYYRRTGKLRSAVGYLERALAIEQNTGNSEAAQTRLNLCATLSQLERHADALIHAQAALIQIYETMSPQMMRGDFGDRDEDGADGQSQETVTVLCIGYHNLGVEHEYLKDNVAAFTAYSSGLRWADRLLAGDHKVGARLRESRAAVKVKIPPGCGALQRADDLAAEWAGRSADGRPRSARSGDSPRVNQMMTPRGDERIRSHEEEGDSDADRGDRGGDRRDERDDN